jgi:NTE family protein
VDAAVGIKIESRVVGPKKILFVRSGGGIPGLDIHAGITLALEECGIVSTHNTGTSAGAIIAALDSAGYSAEEIVATILNLTTADVRQERPLWKLRMPWIDSMLASDPIRSILNRLLPVSFYELVKPLQVVATRRCDAAVRWFGSLTKDPGAAHHRLVDCVLASMSIYGIFPPVEIGFDEFVDGGVRANLPLPSGWGEYDEVWLLIAQAPVNYPDGKSMITRLLRNVSWLLRDQVEDVLDQVRLSPKIRIVRPDCGQRASLLRFDHNLISEAHVQARFQIQKMQEAPIDLEPAN